MTFHTGNPHLAVGLEVTESADGRMALPLGEAGSGGRLLQPVPLDAERPPSVSGGVAGGALEGVGRVYDAAIAERDAGGRNPARRGPLDLVLIDDGSLGALIRINTESLGAPGEWWVESGSPTTVAFGFVAYDEQGSNLVKDGVVAMREGDALRILAGGSVYRLSVGVREPSIDFVSQADQSPWQSELLANQSEHQLSGTIVKLEPLTDRLRAKLDDKPAKILCTAQEALKAPGSSTRTAIEKAAALGNPHAAAYEERWAGETRFVVRVLNWGREVRAQVASILDDYPELSDDKRQILDARLQYFVANQLEGVREIDFFEEPIFLVEPLRGGPNGGSSEPSSWLLVNGKELKQAAT